MDNEKLANLLFPEINKTPEFWEQKYTPRNLPEGAEVTRFAPSPTGFVHFGALFTSLANFLVAKKTNGAFYLRIEDTDKKREVENGADLIKNTLSSFDINFNEGEGFGGNYGPYTQSLREEIYKTYAKQLVREGKAYPCFCSANELDAIRTSQEKQKQDIGYYGEFAKCRNLSFEEIEENLKQGKTFVLRFKCPYTSKDKITTFDLIRGERTIPQNQNDVVILKSNGLPPYNLAHVVDDHLMKTTIVMRSDEWLPSLSEHLQLFEAFGFTPPKYAHISPIQKIDENGNRRKLSKRKDPESDMRFFAEQGFPNRAVKDYILTLLNSDFEEWRAKNPQADILEFDFDIKKTSASGSLFDLIKLTDISKNYVSKLTNNQVFDLALNWAKEFDEKFFENLTQNKNYWLDILNIDREIAKPRKDISHMAEIKNIYSYMFDENFDGKVIFPDNFKKQDIANILKLYPSVFDENDDQQTWFSKIKDVSEKIGFAREVKEFKQNPEAFGGHCGDTSTIIRVALTGRTQTPNLYDICKLLGKDKITSRFEKVLQNLL